MSETQLWLEVLQRAVMDARLEPRSGAVSPRQAQEVKDARTYLTTPSKGLEAVCAMAGVDMDWLIDHMKPRIVGAGDLVSAKEAKPYSARGQVRNVLYEFDGRYLTVKQLSVLSGISKHVIYTRLNKGWSIEAALKPLNMQGRRSAAPHHSTVCIDLLF